MRYLWITGGFLALACGIFGIFVPLFPTVPFLLLAAFCFARGSQRLHDWLITHPRFGEPIVSWTERGAIGMRAKLLASASLIATFSVSLALGLGAVILAVQGAVLGGVAVFIWSRPSA
ncbi:YbaN family protein [Tropicimonas sp. S265A]|uniref:YbaN family protein n=1 Tax=Tropicimonas sp. S265A TaxID=3415134 RepID=UPI003C7B4F2F